MERKTQIFENKYKKDEVMEKFQQSMNDILNKFYDKTSSLQSNDMQDKIRERQKRRDEEYKLQEERKIQRKIQFAESNRLLSNIQSQEKQIVNQYSSILGIDQDQSLQESSVDQKLRLVSMKRKFPNKILKPLSYRQSNIYNFPHDIWYVVSLYMETLSVLKLEKTCMQLYQTFNKKCVDCDNSNFLLNPKCKHFWRQQYIANNYPFIKNEEYANVSCRVMKALVSRDILQNIFSERLLRLRQNMCFKSTHALKVTKKNSEHFYCDLCDEQVQKKNYCGKICMKHKQYSLFVCLYPVPQNGKQVPHKCYCICCMTLMSDNDTMTQLRKDLAFYIGLKQYTVFINFKQYSASKLINQPPVKVAFIHEY